MQYLLFCPHVLTSLLFKILTPYFPPVLLYTVLFPFNQICSIFTPPPPPLCWALLVILGFGEGVMWQCWHLFEGLALCQPLSITPATRVTLLDLSPTNLSADALCGRKTSGHSVFGIRTAKVPVEDLKMGWWKPLNRFYKAEEVRLLLRKRQPSSWGWGLKRSKNRECKTGGKEVRNKIWMNKAQKNKGEDWAGQEMERDDRRAHEA